MTSVSETLFQKPRLNRYVSLATLLIGLLILVLPIAAQDALAPDPIPGEAVYIAFPVAITLDGDTADWAGVPTTTVTTGTMLSPDPAENGSFTFALAADEANLYILMTMPDATIVTGQHGENYYDEDSMEFFVNLSDELFPPTYDNSVYQININPGDIGNDDPSTLTITGTNHTLATVTGSVFATDDGWGFEAALPLPDGFVEHGREIGFQAQANGSSGENRDVKLIWSTADTADNSWQNPSVFGIGVFYEVGSTDIPAISARSTEVEEVVEAEPESDTQRISLNQVGYLPDAPKFAALANIEAPSESWSLLDAATDEEVATGTLSDPIEDTASADTLQIADFSDFTTPGTYKLAIGDAVSVSFTIGTDIYAPLAVDAARYFYLNRSGIELDAEHAGEDYARPAGHVSDSAVTCWSGEASGQTFDGCTYTLDASKGWYDAGDFGKYVVNGGIATWTLLNLFERMPTAYPDGSLNIPESGNGVSDILDEARWEVEFLLGMQVPEGEPLAGMAHHKLHALEWDGLPAMPPTDVSTRLLMPPSTAATYNLAAVAAQCARIYAEIDLGFASRCLQASRRAFDAAEANPLMLYGSIPGNGGGDYGDSATDDERYWAAAELYLTTGEERFIDAMSRTRHMRVFAGLGKDGVAYWGDVAAMGQLSLITHEAELPDGTLENLTNGLVQTADDYLERIDSEGYRLPQREYAWGSNSGVLNNAIVLAYAHDLTGDAKYLGGVTEAINYLLGMNPLAFSYVSGYGTFAMSHPHHRVWANQPGSGYPAPPPGALAGGPNAAPADPAAIEAIGGVAGASRRYIDHIDSYSTNEVAINWNAPLVWVAAYLANAG